MKLKCSHCSNEIDNCSCECNKTFEEIPLKSYLRKFQENDWSVVDEVSNRFANYHTSNDDRIRILDFLEKQCLKRDIQRMSIVTVANLLQRIRGPYHLEFSKKMVVHWPRDFSIRSIYADSLDLSDDVEDRNEAIKQRIISTTLHCLFKKMRSEFDQDQFYQLLEFHLNSMYREMKVQEGIEKYPSKRLRYIEMNRIHLARRVKKRMKELLEVWEHIETYSIFPEKDPKVKCILDTNAISTTGLPKHFRNPSIDFIVPVAVLLELANWTCIDRFPLEIENVRVKKVNEEIPKELEIQFSKLSGVKPSLTKKKIAALALMEKADAIITSDKRFVHSDLSQFLKMNYGIHCRIIHPDDIEELLKEIDS